MRSQTLDFHNPPYNVSAYNPMPGIFATNVSVRRVYALQLTQPLFSPLLTTDWLGKGSVIAPAGEGYNEKLLRSNILESCIPFCFCVQSAGWFQVLWCDPVGLEQADYTTTW